MRVSGGNLLQPRPNRFACPTCLRTFSAASQIGSELWDSFRVGRLLSSAPILMQSRFIIIAELAAFMAESLRHKCAAALSR